MVDHLTSGGKLNSPLPQRVFWAVMEGVIAAVLLLGGGLKTLQTALVCTGLPFALILLVMIYSLYLCFSQEAYVEEAVEKAIENVEAKHWMKEVISATVQDDVLVEQIDTNRNKPV